MRGAKSCPACGFLLRYADAPGSPAAALRFVAVQLLLWVALALGLAWLWAPPGERELYALLAFAVLVAWWRMQPRARADGQALLERRQYRCARCGRRYAGSDLSQGDA